MQRFAMEHGRNKDYILKLIKNLFLMVLIASPALIFLGITYTREMLQDQQKMPYIHWNGLDPQSEVYVSWETSDSVNTILYLGTDPGLLSLYEESLEKTQLHRVSLTGLVPDTHYYYQAYFRANSGDLQEFGPVGRFRTAPSGNIPFNFTMIADTQQFFGTGHYHRIAAALGRDSFDSDFLVIAGDVGQESDDQNTWNLFFKETARYSDKIPIVPVTGNHDDNVPESMFAKYFGVATSPDKFYYSFNYSNVQFICADISNTDTVHLDREEHQAHYEWLNATLEASQNQDFRVLVFHRNFYVSSHINHDFQVFIDRMIDDYNISLIVHGHTHHYERLWYRNTTVLCLGTGGGFLNFAFLDLPESQRIQTVPSYTQAFVDGEVMELITYDLHGRILDHFKIEKEGSFYHQVEVPI